MIALFLGLAVAAPDQTLTAETLAPGDAVVRQPTGPSAVGLREGTELWLVPLDLAAGGPRLGLEQRLVDGAIAWSAGPSIAEKHTGRRTTAGLETTVTTSRGAHAVHGHLRLDGHWTVRTDLGETVTRQTHFDRLQVPLRVVWDAAWTPRTTVRTRMTLPLRHLSATLPYASGSVAIQHAWGRVRIEGGAGVLVGRPHERWALERYRTTLVIPYPKLDLWVALQGRTSHPRAGEHRLGDVPLVCRWIRGGVLGPVVAGG